RTLSVWEPRHPHPRSLPSRGREGRLQQPGQAGVLEGRMRRGEASVILMRVGYAEAPIAGSLDVLRVDATGFSEMGANGLGHGDLAGNIGIGHALGELQRLDGIENEAGGAGRTAIAVDISQRQVGGGLETLLFGV